MCAAFVMTTSLLNAQLIITGVYDGPLSGGTPKGVELYATQNIADMSAYGISSANNGNGTTAPNPEYVFLTGAVTAGTYLYVTTNAAQFTAYFGFAPNYVDGSMSINGDDAIELFQGTTVIDVFGDVNTDGSGTAWEYLDGWAYRSNTATAPSTTFTVADWTYSSPNALDGCATNATCSSVFPIGTYAGGSSGGTGTVVTLTSNKDNTLFESGTGTLSNGAGPRFIAGRTGVNSNGLIRRGLLQFDLSSIPANATITNVKLTMEMVKTPAGSGARTISLHTVTKDWGEGTSNDGSGGGSGNGASATTNDATWLHNFYNTSTWTNTGGDYAATASGSASVDGLGSYDWTSAGMITDVQNWLNGTTSNFGWAVIGDESVLKTTKHFASKEDATAANRPTLEVTYTLPAVVVNPYPYSDIATVTTSDMNGVADSLNQKFELRGVVTSPDYDGNNGYSFYMADATGGINVFSFSDVSNYTVMQGDSIRVKGTIAQFNGLTEIVPDSIFLESQNNALPAPMVVTALGEMTEGELIRINGVTLADATQWNTSGSSFNVDITNGTDTLTMRIDSDINIIGTPAPMGSFDVIGLGGQFDGSNPYTEGYQFYPRDTNDIMPSAPVFVNPYPYSDIATVTTSDMNGVADSLNQKFELRGVVTSPDYDGNNGYSFYIADATGGINVFSFSDVDSYVVTRGDSISVFGTIAQFNGLTEIIPDSILLVSQNNALPAPMATTVLDETTEGELVKIFNVTLTDATQWNTSGSSFNVDITNGTDTFTMRIDSDINIIGTPAPTGNFDVVGLGGQFDGSNPYTEGYQIYPRDTNDIMPIPVTAAPDIVITEIMYNSPDGNDLEFFEIYNNGNAPADLAGYTTTQGVSFTFPSVTLNPGEYFVATDDSVAFHAFYGFAAHEWASGSLSNGGEDIVIADAMGMTVDSVDYEDNTNGWPVIADSEGPSLVLCDANADNNDPANWQRAITSTGKIEDDQEVFANPGMGATCTADPIITFQYALRDVPENGNSIDVELWINNPNMMATTVDVNVSMASTATAGADFTFTSPTTVTFPAGTDTVQTINIPITDDMMTEGDETIVLTLSNATNNAVVGTDTLIITIQDDDAALTKALILTGVYDVSVGSSPKGYEFYVAQNIPDLSVFGVGVANNGGGTDGIEYNFPAVAANAGDFIYLASDTADFFNFFGIHAQFEHSGNGTEHNGDDAIEIFEGVTVIDIYGDINVDGSGEPWEYQDSWVYRNCSTGPDSANFQIGNWTIAPVNLFDGFNTNAATPQPMPLGTYMTVCPQNIIAVDDVVEVPYNTAVTFDPGANDNIPNPITGFGIVQNPTNGSVSVDAITGLVTYTPNTGFCGTDMGTYFIQDAFGSDTAMVTFNVACPIPSYDIATVTTTNANGDADSLNVICELNGTVYGIDFRGGNGYSFTLIDATGGINVFSFGDVDGYVVNEGDNIRVVGEIIQFNGLTEIEPDTIQVTGTGTLNAPTIVTALDESTESEFIKIEGLTIIDPAQWDATGASFNIDLTDGTNTYTMRVDSDTDIAGTAAPTLPFDLTGIGSQFDNSAPYTEGYQIFPRYLTDIELISNTNEVSLANKVQFYPNPVSEQLFINSAVALTEVRISNMLGQTIFSAATPNQQTTISVADLANGVYAITFVAEGTTWTTQFIKQ